MSQASVTSSVSSDHSGQWRGILFAIITTIIWSGNFIIARGVYPFVPPITLALLRWVTGTIILYVIVRKRLQSPIGYWRKHGRHLFWTSLLGVSVFNTLMYVAAHEVPAINMALIGTTSSPVFTFLLAAIFLKEKIPPLRLAGLLICISGILLLIAKGDFTNLLHFRFSHGDVLVLGAGLSFAIYNIFVRRKPADMDGVNYLFMTFLTGTLMLVPAAAIEQWQNPGVQWNAPLIGGVLYLGAGASVAAFFLWNAALARLGAARTAIFGNLIPVFSSIEAVLILGEKIQRFHWVGMGIVAIGLLLANLRRVGPSR